VTVHVPADLFDSEGFGASTESLDLEAARGALDELFFLARQYKSSQRFIELLEFVSRFKRYSMFNAVLVHTQMPGARYVLTPRRWAQEFSRRPKKNAQPLVMLQPMGPVMFGIDVSQTEGRPLPEGFENPFAVEGALRREEFDRTVSNTRRDGVEVHRRALGSTMGGYVRNAADPDHRIGLGFVWADRRTILVAGRNVKLVAEITLNANLPDETNYATLTHELGHLYCGHVGTPDLRWWPDRGSLDRNSKEFEAESVSFLVCKRAGLVTPAAEYLNGYLNAHDTVPSISLDTVLRAAQRIEAMRLKVMKFRIDGNEE
jgi:hypothetical protein